MKSGSANPAPDAVAESAALAMLGLARRAGRAVMGTRAVLGAARADRLALAVLARDASSNARARVCGAMGAAAVPLVCCGTRWELGRAVGKGPVAVVGIEDARLARRVVEHLGSPPML